MPKQMRKAPAYCQGLIDRHGKARWYFRRPGYPRATLPGLPWSPEFMAAYEAASKGEPLEVGASRTQPRSISAAIMSYYTSSDFTALSDSTKKTYRGILERFREEHGAKGVANLERRHVQKLVSARAETPAAANNLLRMIHLIMRHSIELGWRRDDPTRDVRKIRYKTAGFLTWEEEHIVQFVACHKPGTRAHLALSLLLHTGQRRSDVVRMGFQHVRGGSIYVKQQKTKQELYIPLHPELGEILDKLPREDPAFLVTRTGQPYTGKGFTNWFRNMVQEAKLPAGLSPHGLRKATCRRLAEAGCTAHEIMAISGHTSLAEVTRYTVAASRAKLAERAIASLLENEKRDPTVKPD
ncbi:tyrosine-type recombinase/integrase [Mangrovicoccus ximenensis]|uniref:tyrosine-type recombinase/integrase n=1 Tax=Mangrovicoccus ximenensis TaxID=1911570 RepID=UPI000D39B1CB|nr:site-specific integrase [Mangrovicoccus ximenensis]